MISIVLASGTEHVIIDEHRYGKDKRSKSNGNDDAVCFQLWKCLIDSCPGLIEIDIDYKLTQFESRLITEHNHEPIDDEFEVHNGTIKLFRKRRVKTVPKAASLPIPPLQPKTSHSETILDFYNDKNNVDKLRSNHSGPSLSVAEDCENIVVESSDLELLLQEINESNDNSNNHNDDDNDDANFSSTFSVLDTKLVQPYRGKNHLIHDGYRYRRSDSTAAAVEQNGSIVWRCAKKNCNGRIKVNNGTVVVGINSFQHSHPPPDDDHLLNETKKKKTKRKNKTLKKLTIRLYENGEKKKSAKIVSSHKSSTTSTSSNVNELPNDDLMTEDEDYQIEENLEIDDIPLKRSRQSKRKCIQNLSRLNDEEDEDDDYYKDEDEVIRSSLRRKRIPKPQKTLTKLKNGSSLAKKLPVINCSNDLLDRIVNKFPKIQIVHSNHQNQHIVLDRNEYRVVSVGDDENTSIWRCVKNDCKARVKINVTPGEDSKAGCGCKLWSQHNHTPESMVEISGNLKVEQRKTRRQTTAMTADNSSNANNSERQRLTELETVECFVGKIPNIEIVESTHGKKHVLLDGFRYRLGKGWSDGTSTWRCVVYDCKARVRINGSEKSYDLWLDHHGHQPETLEAKDGILKVRRKLKPPNPRQRTKHNSFSDAIGNLIQELPNIEIVESAHGKQHIELDGFRYRLAQGWSDGSSTWRCPLTKCSGSIRFSMMNSTNGSSGQKKCDIFKHTHEPNRRKNEIKKVLREVRRRALTTDATPIEIIKQCIREANVTTDISVQEVMNQQRFTKILEKAKNKSTPAPTTSSRVQPVMVFTDDAIELDESVKGKQYIFVDGYRYRFGRQFADGYTYWRCSEKDCKGSMKINISGDHRQTLSEHFHLPNQGQNVVRKFANELKRKALAQPQDEPRKIIEECRSKVPKLVEHFLPTMAANLRMIKRTRQQLGLPLAAEKCTKKQNGDNSLSSNVGAEVQMVTSATLDEARVQNVQQQPTFGIDNLINQPCTAPSIDFANVFHLPNFMEE